MRLAIVSVCVFTGCAAQFQSLRESYRKTDGWGSYARSETVIASDNTILFASQHDDSTTYHDGLRDLMEAGGANRFGDAGARSFYLLRGGVTAVRTRQDDGQVQFARFMDNEWIVLDHTCPSDIEIVPELSSGEILVLRRDTGAVDLWSWSEDGELLRVPKLPGMTEISSSGCGTWIAVVDGQLVFGSFDGALLVPDAPLNVTLQSPYELADLTWLDPVSVLINRCSIVSRDRSRVELQGRVWPGTRSFTKDYGHGNFEMRRVFLLDAPNEERKLCIWTGNGSVSEYPVSRDVLDVSPSGRYVCVSYGMGWPTRQRLMSLDERDQGSHILDPYEPFMWTARW